MEHYKSYKFRIYPTEEQEKFFAKTFGCARKVYNLMLNDRLNAKQGSSLPTLSEYKEVFPYLNEVDDLALLNAEKNLIRAYNKHLRENSTQSLRFKSRYNPVQSYTSNNRKESIQIINQKYITLPKLDSLVRIKQHRKPRGIILSATISRHASGRYHVSLLCKEKIKKLPKTNRAVGIDLGITNFAVLSNGQKIDNNQFTVKMEKKLKREQRKLSKRARQAKAKGIDLSDAKNYQKQKRKVAKIHEKVTNQRDYFLQKLSTAIIKNHDVICVENLNAKDMLRNHKLAKKVSDVSWSKFIEMLLYKAEWYGKEIVMVSQWYPSSQTCSKCNHIDGKKSLDIREWKCPKCKTIHDRDINASINILKEGLRIKQYKFRTVGTTGIAR